MMRHLDELLWLIVAQAVSVVLALHTVIPLLDVTELQTGSTTCFQVFMCNAMCFAAVLLSNTYKQVF